MTDLRLLLMHRRKIYLSNRRVLGHYGSRFALTVLYLLSLSFPVKKRYRERLINITYEHNV